MDERVSEMRISFVVPAYNEVATVCQVLDGLTALGLDAQLVVFDDGSTDGTAEAVERWTDVVFGSRLSGGRPKRSHLFWHLVGNRILSLVTNVLYNTTISDMETGYKAFRTDALRSLRLTRDDFGIEPDMNPPLSWSVACPLTLGERTLCDLQRLRG
jgi:hypothetical protein